jgi:hypothetical protein
MEREMIYMRSFIRRFRTPLLAAAPALALLAAAPALASQSGILFTGGGSGSTPEGAIQSARFDAEAGGSGMLLNTCTQVGEPRLFHYPGARRPWAAEVDMFCTE